MKQSKTILPVYLAKVLINCLLIMYLILATYYPIFNENFYNFVFAIDLLVSFILVKKYALYTKINFLRYFLVSIVNLYIFFTLMHHVTSGFMIQTAIIALLTPLDGYKLFKRVNISMSTS